MDLGTRKVVSNDSGRVVGSSEYHTGGLASAGRSGQPSARREDAKNNT